MRLLCLLLLSLVIFSCSRNEEEPGPRTSEFSEAFPLAVGNYWVYQNVVTDGTGKVFQDPQLDSVWIESDTMINGKRFFVQRSTYESVLKTYITDSTGYIVSNVIDFRYTIFSRINAIDTLEGNDYFMRVMTNPGQKVTVLAGTFETVSSIILLKRSGEESPDSNVPVFNKDYTVYEQSDYANNVGLVKVTLYHFGGMLEQKLVRYKVN